MYPKQVVEVELFLNKKIRQVETNRKCPKLRQLMIDMREIEARVEQYVVLNKAENDNSKNMEMIPTSEEVADGKVTMSIDAVNRSNMKPKGFKAGNKNFKKETNNRAPRVENTKSLMTATSQVQAGKYASVREALAAMRCSKCNGRWHVEADCRKEDSNHRDNHQTSTHQYTNNNDNTSGNVNRHNKKETYAIADTSNEIEQALRLIEYHHNNGCNSNPYNTTMMIEEIHNDHPTALKEYYKWRYNYDNHSNISIYNNEKLVNIQPTKEHVSGYGGTAMLLYSCEHPIFGRGYYDKNSKYNILGLTPLDKAGFIEHKPKSARNAYTLLHHHIYGDIKFDRNVISDFYSLAHSDLCRITRNHVEPKEVHTTVSSKEYTDEFNKAEDIV